MKQVLVIKIGGSILQGDLSALITDLQKIIQKTKVILVHGWSYEVNELYGRLGMQPAFYTSSRGFMSRMTDKQAIELILMTAAGVINKTLVHQLSLRDISSFGLSGIDGGILKAKKKIFRIYEGGTLRQIATDQTGKVTSVNVGAIFKLLESYDCLVITPIAVGEKQEILSTDADSAAAQMAISLRSNCLVYLSNVDGYQEKGEAVSFLDKYFLKRAIELSSKGMKKKLWAAKQALEGNVQKVMIGDGTKDIPITRLLNGFAGSRISFRAS